MKPSRATATTLVEIVGICLVAAGFGLIWTAAALIVGGLGLILVGWRLS